MSGMFFLPLRQKEEGVWLPEQVEVSQHGGQDLVIQEAEPEDAGLYTCVASNSVGSSTREYVLQVLGDYILDFKLFTILRIICKEIFLNPYIALAC